MNAIEGCIFDLDGVIVDTAKYHYLAWKKLSEELGINFTLKDNERLKGVSRIRSLEIILELGGLKLDEAKKLELAERKNKWYVEYISKIDKREILGGVEKFINVLKKNNIKTAIGSASKNTMIILKNIGMDKSFDAIIDGNKVSKAKPDPEVFLLAAKEIGILPKNCVVFEDAAAGIEAAKRAGMFAIGIGDKKILNKADKVVNDFTTATLDLIS